MAETSFNLHEPQLLTEITSLDEFKGGFPTYVQPKMDGFRLLAFVEEGEKNSGGYNKVTLMSRAMKPFNNFKELEHAFSCFPAGFVYDCEVVGYVGADRAKTSFKALSVRARSLRGKNTHIKTKAFIFDCISLKEWNSQVITQFEHRSAAITNNYEEARGKAIMRGVMVEEHVSTVMTSIVHNMEGLISHTEDFMRVVSDEGVVIKKPNSLYKFGRGSDWIKYKKSITVDLMIVGFNEGRTQFNPETGLKDGGTYPSGMVGSLICEGQHDGKCVKTEPKGFTNALARDMFNNFEKYRGKYIEIEGQELTRAAYTPYYSVKHPNFVRFRPDKDGTGTRRYEPEDL